MCTDRKSTFLFILNVTVAVAASAHEAAAAERPIGWWLEQAVQHAEGLEPSHKTQIYYRQLMRVVGRGGERALIDRAAHANARLDMQAERYNHAVAGMVAEGRFPEAQALIKQAGPQLLNPPAAPDVHLDATVVASAGLIEMAHVMGGSTTREEMLAGEEKRYRLDYATALAHAGEIDPAIEQLEIAEKLVPAPLLPRPTDFLLALARRNRVDLAAAYIRKPTYVDTKVGREMVRAYCRGDRLDDAIVAAKRYPLGQAKGWQQPLVDLVHRLGNAQRLDDAVDVLKACGNDPHVQTAVALVAYKLGKVTLGKQMLAQLRMSDDRRLELVEGFTLMGRHDLAGDMIKTVKSKIDRRIAQAIAARCAAQRGDLSVYGRLLSEVEGEIYGKKRKILKPNRDLLVAVAEAHGVAKNRKALHRTMNLLLTLYARYGNPDEPWLHETIRIHFQYGDKNNLEAVFATADTPRKRSVAHLAVAQCLLDHR